MSVKHVKAEVDNKKLSMRGIDVYRVKNGKIAKVWLFPEDSNAEDAFWGSLK
ncbi:MAG TPA: hypothetical protein VLA92_03585 [Candidatus Saccharimonadales bacterium]|nr:hypothetical protein [Candidatus Saccharimonadales bacterium]